MTNLKEMFPRYCLLEIDCYVINKTNNSMDIITFVQKVY